MSSKNKIRVYEDAAGEYRWTKHAANGEPIADSGEGYTRLDDAVEAAQREQGDSGDYLILEVTLRTDGGA